MPALITRQSGALGGVNFWTHMGVKFSMRIDSKKKEDTSDQQLEQLHKIIGTLNVVRDLISRLNFNLYIFDY